MEGRSLGADAWRRLKKNRLAMLGGLVLVLMVLACGILPPLLGLDHMTNHLENVRKSPAESPLFGTDSHGRDYFARVLKGGWISLQIGLAATLVSVIIGTIYGAVSGFYGGKLDEIMMAILDFLYAIPYMFLVILILLVVGEKARGDPLPIFMALGVVQWLTTARIVRGQVLTLRNQEFVAAAKSLGASDARIIFRHILPNVVSVVIVYATLTVPSVILLESFLSFVGLGVDLSWGQLVAEGVKVVNPIESDWWLLFFPSLFLAITLLSLNFLGDGLRDALDPKGKR